MYDINPNALGRLDNLVTRASDFGKQSEVFDGLDLTLNARFGRGALVQGGVSMGRTVTDACYLRSAPHLSSGFQSYLTPTIGASLNTPLLPDYCRTVMPWSALTEVKLSGVYTLPADIQVAATFQNLPGAVVAASFAATNAQIAPSLGRNLAACGSVTPCTATVVVSNLVVPNTMFEDRLNQFDLRFSKIFRVGGARLQGMLDIYNLFNANTVLDVNARFGPNWLRPNSILSARLFKFGMQLDF